MKNISVQGYAAFLGNEFAFLGTGWQGSSVLKIHGGIEPIYSILVYFVTSVERCRRSVIWRASRIDKGINRRLENPPAP